MEREALFGANPPRLGEGYQTQWEMLQDLSAWVDLLLYEYYRRHQYVYKKHSRFHLPGQ